MLRKTPSPALIVILASAAWGLFWLPLRTIENQGLAPSWTTATQFIAPFLVLTPFAIARYLRQKPIGLAQYRSGIFVGLALALYLDSILLTDVARALILFYAMPAWGTLLERFVLHRPITKMRLLSLILSIAGLLTILGGDLFAGALNLGDIMALLSGIAFAIGALQIRQSAETATVFEQLYAFFFYGMLASLTLTLLPIPAFGNPPSLQTLFALAPFLVIVSAFLIPIMGGIYWGSRHVDPGRLGIFLQAEAIVGIVSAALLTAEPFGFPQAIGALLIISAGIAEAKAP